MPDEFKILIADDSQALRLLVKQVIKQNNITRLVYEAENGKKAVEIFAKTKPDLIIMDLLMPELSGIEATKIIHRVSPNTRILVLTTSHDTNHMKDALSNGASDIMYKPFNQDALANKIIKHLREKETLEHRQIMRAK